MRLLFLLLIAVVPRYVYAVGCTNTSYNNVTCKQTTTRFSGGDCNPTVTHNNAISVTAGNRLLIFVDTDVTGTGATVSDSASNSWVAVTDGTHTLSPTTWNSGASQESMYTTIASSTVSLDITLHCPATTSAYEFWITEISSSVGTVGIDCVASFVQAVAGSNPSSTCTAAHSNDMGYSMVDWNNGATAGVGWTVFSENGENVQEGRAMASTTVNGIWTLGPDNYISATIAFSDGAAVGPPKNQFPRVQ